MGSSRKHPRGELSIHRLLKAQAGRSPEAVAIQAPGRAPLTYRRLFLHVEDVIQTLRSMGVGRHHRVAIAHPNGPEVAAAFLAVSAAAVSAPLNPAYSAREFDFYLTDLNARALLVQAGTETQAVAVAQALNIPVIELSPLLDAEAGLFTLSYDGRALPSTDDVAQPEDVALVLHTSGTTSRPKIVPLTQSNICSSAHNVGLSLELNERDSCLNVMPLFHIHGLVGAVLSSLASGASVICAPGFYAPQFFAWLEECRPTWYTAVPTMHQAILSRAQSQRGIIERCPLRFIRSSSAALPPKVMAELESVFNAPVIEAYGMTEAAHQMASNPLPPRERKPGSVGRAAGPEIAIMDEAGSLVTAGEVGEIVIRGDNVARGYEKNQEANRRAFTNGWFRTGDQGFLDREGYLYISGRLKEIINRGGEKVSPREVDEALMQHPAITQALAFSVPHSRLGEEVAAAVVLRENATASEREVREFVAARLAYFKVPQRILFLEEIPKGATGKLQRIGLAQRLGLTTIEGDGRGADEAKEVSSPSTQLEMELAAIWTEALGLERVDKHDNFFSLGGDSMLAARIISGVDEAMGVKLSFLAFSDAPTVAEMARHIEEAKESELLTPALMGQGRQSSAHQGESLFLSEDTRRADFRENDMEEVHVFHLSFAQQRLWFLDQLEPGSAVYNIPGALRLTGHLHVAALEQSLREIINRHEALRTTFASVNGEPVQVVTRTLDWTMPLVDLRAYPLADRESLARQLATEEARAAFDLRCGPLLRARLLRLDEAEHVLLLNMHHIVSDLWSRSVLFRELAVCYKFLSEGQTVSLPALPIQYADFATWQREWLKGEALATQLAYWKQQLNGSVGVLELPTDRHRPPAQTFNGAHQSIILPHSLNEALKRLARREGSTLFMVLLAAYATLLHRYTGQEDINIGSPIAGRTRTETEELIGFFINTLVLRIDLSDNPTFRSLLARVREMALGAYSHQELPFEKLVEELQPVRDASRTPLFQTMFILQNAPRPVFELAGLTLSPLEVETHTSKFELTLEVVEKPEGLLCRFEHNTDLFDTATIERMMGNFQTLLEAVVADPNQSLAALPLLTEAERHQLLAQWNETKTDYPPAQCLHQLFEAQAQRAPDRIAVFSDSLRLTYAELERRSNQLARHLRLALGLKREEIVGVCLERSTEMFTGLLGILKAGGAYLPLDPAYPKERLAFMLEDARPSVLLIQERTKKALPRHEGRVVSLDSDWPLISRESEERLATEVTPESLACIIYTSGSTGTPNGVQATHRGAINRFQWMWQTYPFEEGEVCCQKTSLNFVDSVWEIFGPLLQGVSTVIISDEKLKDTRQLTRTLAAHHVTRIVLVPSLLRALLETSREMQSLLPELKYWITSGEAVTPDLAKRFFEAMPQSRLVNLYGSSEVSADVTCYEVSGDQAYSSIPIGRPIANTQVYVLDPHRQPVPIGVRGELYVGGASLARGYHRRPELTAQKFIPNPFSRESSGARLYRTGDAARYLPDGNLEYRGRLDRQVKVRGSRVEPGEVEAALALHPKVLEVAVLPNDDATGGQHLVAYIVAAQGAELSSEGLRTFLKDRLPEYMMPSTFFMLDALPLMPNGKVNRLALLSTTAHVELQAEQPFIAPRTPTEELLAGIWAEVLRCERIGIHDDFFTLKGHSLLATRVISRVYDAFQVELPVRSIFDTPTIAGLAGAVEKALRTSVPQQATAAIVPSPRERHSIRLSKGEAVIITEALVSGSSWASQPSAPDGATTPRAVGPTEGRAPQMRPSIEQTFIEPRDAVELSLVRLWEEVLDVRPVGVRDDFFELGGHSLLATRLFSRIERMYGYDLPVATLFQAPTVERLATLLRQEEHTLLASPLVAIQPEGDRPPFFCVHAIGGGVLSYRSLSRHLGQDQPFYGLQAHGLDDERLRNITVEEMAAGYIVSVRGLQPDGPFLLGGHSFGGVVAFEMARQLRKEGHEVALLALFEPAYPGYPSIVERIRLHRNNLKGLTAAEKLAYLRSRAGVVKRIIKSRLRRNMPKAQKHAEQPASSGSKLTDMAIRALINYQPQVYSGSVDLFRARMQPAESQHTQTVWERLADGNLRVHLVPGDHVSIIAGEDVSILAEQLKIRLDEAIGQWH